MWRRRWDDTSQEEYTVSIKGSDDLPDINQLKSIRKYVFVIDEDTYALCQAVVHVKGNTRIKKDAAITMFDQENCLFRADGTLMLQDCRVTLTRDESYSGDITLYGSYLDCNGYQFCLSDGGTLEQMGGLVNLDYGTLSVDGNYILHGNSILQMIRAEDLLQVRGSFNMYSCMNHSSMLKNGRMELWGDFDQAGDAMSFASSENFVIAFIGKKMGKVK